MNWLTIVWSMGAAACMTLGLIHLGIWARDRSAFAHVLFATAALAAGANGLFELDMLQAESVGEYRWAMYWAQIPLAILLVALAWFVRVYFRTGRTWLAFAITGIWAVYIVLHFGTPSGIVFERITSLRRVPTLFGASFAQVEGVPNPLRHLGDVSTVLVVVFLVDASVSLWRRGDHRHRFVVAASALTFILVAGVHTPLVDLGWIRTPYMISLAFLTIIAAMSYQLGADIQQAAALARELSGRLIEAQEGERTRLARELHDDVTQRLARFSIDAARAERTTSDPATTAPLHDLRDGLKQLSQDVRVLAYRLHPSVLYDLGLVEALSAECDRFSQSEGIPAALETDEVPDALPRPLALCFFRVAQEALQNVARHAQAGQVQVRLAAENRRLRLVVQDNGIGFPVGRPTPPPSLGWAGMRERLHLVNGEVKVESKPGVGTTLTAWALLAQTSSEDS